MQTHTPRYARIVQRVALALVAPVHVHAQGIETPRWSLALAGGSIHTTRRDDSASPFRFTGRGSAMNVAGKRSGEHYTFGVSANGAFSNLRTGATASTERLSTGAVDVSALRTVIDRHALRVNVGLDLRTSLEVTRHRFPLLTVPSTLYRFAVGSVGPTVQIANESSRGNFALTMSAPAVAIVDRPYSEVKSASSGLNPVFESFTRLREGHAELSYTTATHRRVQARAAFEATALTYTDPQSVRAVHNTVMIGLVLQSHRQ